jgi:hypothetical protein
MAKYSAISDFFNSATFCLFLPFDFKMKSQLFSISAAKRKSGPQKNLSSRENPRPNFLQILQNRAEKGLFCLMCVIYPKS